MISLGSYTIALVIVIVIGKLGDSVGPLLISTHPIQLLLLNSNDIHCLGTALLVEPKWWFVTCAFRRMIEDPLFYMFGYHHGEQAVQYLSRYIPAVEKVKHIVSKASYLGVMLDPGMIVCLFAGCTKMNPLLFWSLNFTGTALRLMGIHYLAHMFPDQIHSGLAVVREYQLAVAVLISVFVAVRIACDYPAVVEAVTGKTVIQTSLPQESKKQQ
eukprot:TRINITY_DN34516_c0_g1_i1.p1 TRINITY_DN34516_c0_g1~~TRINITY_DN34516_c0_g1_i1.p1  ORF type:complete len:214 (+),score=17.68 TRINITY_DN34516_c0_g1_i1:43-684(+)